MTDPSRDLADCHDPHAARLARTRAITAHSVGDERRIAPEQQLAGAVPKEPMCLLLWSEAHQSALDRLVVSEGDRVLTDSARKRSTNQTLIIDWRVTPIRADS